MPERDMLSLGVTGMGAGGLRKFFRRRRRRRRRPPPKVGCWGKCVEKRQIRILKNMGPLVLAEEKMKRNHKKKKTNCGHAARST